MEVTMRTEQVVKAKNFPSKVARMMMTTARGSILALLLAPGFPTLSSDIEKEVGNEPAVHPLYNRTSKAERRSHHQVEVDVMDVVAAYAAIGSDLAVGELARKGDPVRGRMLAGALPLRVSSKPLWRRGR
jgi:hypothetical protein